MPYKDLNELPDNVKSVLPKHAKEIYLKAYNNAWNEYKEPKDRRNDESREEVSHKVAWIAVKKVYEKDGDVWKKK